MMSEIHCQPAAKPASPGTLKAIESVFAERLRQIGQEGWTPEHDDCHHSGEMALAAACYAISSFTGLGMATHTWTTELNEFIRRLWPWSPGWWKPKDQRRDLVRAAALIVAEIERFDRAATSDSANG
jgi:hypothetical protein